MLNTAVTSSFNRISVDGDTSTNDTVLLLANGASGVAAADRRCSALVSGSAEPLCTDLAQLIVRDGEGASKFVDHHSQWRARRQRRAPHRQHHRHIASGEDRVCRQRRQLGPHSGRRRARRCAL